ncbi:MAG TPA: hypothetical protein VFA56_02725 [Gaiellaceae bacterium]|nr:hypothetical protein [Gaiellaceae bacterium]
MLGLVGVAAVPGAIAVAQRTAGIPLLDAAWAIPIAALCGAAALAFARGAGGRIRATLERAGGWGRIRLGTLLGVAGICLALAGAIAVGFYELLLRLEG